LNLGPVVGEEQEQRVVVLADLLQVVDQATHVVVQVLDQGGVEVHLARDRSARDGSQVAPERDVPEPLGQVRVGADDAELLAPEWRAC
jgi:hypothetical protein